MRRDLVGPGGLEPPTSRLSGVRSNQAELRAYGRTTTWYQARDRTLHHTTTECRDALKREKGKRNEDGGEPHFIGASITDPRERAAGEASLERR